MTSKSAKHEDAGFGGRLQWRDGTEIESTLAQCFLNAVSSPSPARMEELREATWLLAETLRRRGARPEQALIVLKALLHDPVRQEWKPSLGDSESRMGVSAQVYRRLFDWWLTAFFAKPPKAGTSDGQATADAR